MKKSTVEIAGILVLLTILQQSAIVLGSSETDSYSQHLITLSGAHEITLDAFTWQAYSVDCDEGSILSGSFEVFCDGDLYPGDQQKYDDWVSESIQFYILNETEYFKFEEKLYFKPSFARHDVAELSWIFETPTTGTWYIVYYNTAIYLMTIRGSVTHSDETESTLLVTILLSTSCITIGIFYYWKKRVRKP